MTPTLSYYIIQ